MLFYIFKQQTKQIQPFIHPYIFRPHLKVMVMVCWPFSSQCHKFKIVLTDDDDDDKEVNRLYYRHRHTRHTQPTKNTKCTNTQMWHMKWRTSGKCDDHCPYRYFLHYMKIYKTFTPKHIHYTKKSNNNERMAQGQKIPFTFKNLSCCLSLLISQNYYLYYYYY